MHFQNPEMLWCLFALLIPIAIHLFNLRRYKLTYFSNTEVLRQIEQQTAKTQKLKNRIVLALRCLFIAALVLAFAKPCKNNPEKDILNDNSSLTAIYIDNTMSMKSMAQKTTLLADAREAAVDIVEKMGHSNRFVLITNSFELQNEYPMNRDEMIDHINRMQTEGGPVSLATVLSRIEMIAQQNGFESANVFLCTDFQENMLDIDGFKPKTIKNIVALPMQPDNGSNVYIDSVWLDSPIIQKNMSNTLRIRVVNYSGSDVSALPLSLHIDDETVATASTDIKSNGESEVAMQFVLDESGLHRCRVGLTDYPIVFDNDYNFVLDSKTGMSVVEIGNGPSPVGDIFADDEQFDYLLVDASRLDYEVLRNAQMVVLNTSSEITSTLSQSLLDWMNAGKSVVVFPAANSANLDEFLTLCGPRITGFDTTSIAVESVSQGNEFFADVLLNVPQHADLPKVRQYGVIRPDAQSVVLASMQNALPFLVSKQIGKGHLYLFAVSLDRHDSSLSGNSLFVPLLVKMALNGGAVGSIAHTIGGDDMVSLEAGARSGGLLRLSNDDKTFESIINPVERNGQQYVTIGDMIPCQGFYDITSDGKLLTTTAWNENRSESVMKFASADRISGMLEKTGVGNIVVGKSDGNPGRIVENMTYGHNYWIYLLVTAFLALLAESLVLRLWK